MSVSEQVVADLKACLEQLVPSCLQRIANLRSSHPGLIFISPTLVFDQLKPIAQHETVQRSFGLPATSDDQLGLRNLCIEFSNNILRTTVFSSTPPPSSHSFSDAEFCQLIDQMDTLLSLSLQDLIDPTLPLALLEELMELHTIPTCSQLFSYMESRVKQLTLGLHPTRGKGLFVLRLCNELLRRLSKPSQKHTVFAGRILSMLAAVFPLGERSGVNLRGDFNVENKTVLVDQQEQEEDDKQFKTDGEMYELFWKMQRFFSNPPLLMGLPESSKQSSRETTPAQDESQDPAPDGAKGTMAELRINTKNILELFAAVANKEKELAGASAEQGANSGTAASKEITGYQPGQDLELGQKRKRYQPIVKDGVRYREEAMQQDDQEEQEPQVDVNFFPKFLTGRKLFEYEIRDPFFRRHILVQYLILFQYLLSFTAAAREKWKDWKNKTLQGLFVLSEADDRWIRSKWKEILALLREIPPNGRLFLDTVLQVLKRESNWVRWKTESCPSIEKPPLTAEQITLFANARALLLRAPMPYPHALGTAPLSQLWQEGFLPPLAGTRRQENEMGEYMDIPTDGLEELELAPPIPNLKNYYKRMQREEAKLKQVGEDSEKAATIIETRQSLAWRALRVATLEHLDLFKEMKGPENLEALIMAIEEEENPKKKVKQEEKVEEAPVAVQDLEPKKVEDEVEAPEQKESGPVKEEQVEAPKEDVDMAEGS